MSSLDALLGRIKNDGDELELQGGLDFKYPLALAGNSSAKVIEVRVRGIVAPDTTETVSVPGDYATLNEAVEAIASWFIPGTSFVDIEVAAGHYAASTEATVFRQSCGERVRIVGADYLQEDIVSLHAAPTGAAGAWSVVLNIADTAGMSVGDYAVVAARGGTGDWEIHSGAWRITAIDTVNDRITVLNTAQNAAFPTTTLTDGTVNVLRTVLTYNGCDGIRTEGSKLGLLKNVMIVGDGTGDFSGLNAAGHDGEGGDVASKMSGAGSIVCGEFVGVSTFGANGMVANHGSSIFANSAACSNNGKYGFYAAVASAIEAREACGNGNETGGVIADYGGTAWIAGSHFCGNGGSGAFVFNGGHLVGNEVACCANVELGGDIRFGDATLELAKCNGNGTGGVLCYNGSRLAFDGSTASGNTGPGVRALRGGTIRAEDVTAEDNTTFGLLAEQGGYIYAPDATLSGNTTANRRLAPGGTIEDETGIGWNRAFVHATVSVDQSISLNTETLLDFDTQQTDDSGEYDPTTATYTASTAKSLRRLSVSIAVDMTYSAGDTYELRLKKNGAVIATTIYLAPTASGRASLMLTDLVEVVPGNTLTAHIFQNGGTRTVRSGTTLTRLLITEL